MPILEITMDHKFSTRNLRHRPRGKMIELSGKNAKQKYIEAEFGEIGFQVNKKNVDFNCIGYGWPFERNNGLEGAIIDIIWNDEKSGFNVVLRGNFQYKVPQGFIDDLTEDGSKAALYVTGVVYREGVIRGFISDLDGLDVDDPSTALEIKTYKFIA
jgi:hypothetical protein